MSENRTYEELRETLMKMREVSGRLYRLLNSPECELSFSQLSAISSLIKKLSDLELGDISPDRSGVGNSDKAFLQWTYDRLVNAFGEDPNYGHMHKFRAIIENTSDNQITPNVGV